MWIWHRPAHCGLYPQLLTKSIWVLTYYRIHHISRGCNPGPTEKTECCWLKFEPAVCHSADRRLSNRANRAAVLGWGETTSDDMRLLFSFNLNQIPIFLTTITFRGWNHHEVCSLLRGKLPRDTLTKSGKSMVTRSFPRVIFYQFWLVIKLTCPVFFTIMLSLCLSPTPRTYVATQYPAQDSVNLSTASNKLDKHNQTELFPCISAIGRYH